MLSCITRTDYPLTAFYPHTLLKEIYFLYRFVPATGVFFLWPKHSYKIFSSFCNKNSFLVTVTLLLWQEFSPISKTFIWWTKCLPLIGNYSCDMNFIPSKMRQSAWFSTKISCEISIFPGKIPPVFPGNIPPWLRHQLKMKGNNSCNVLVIQTLCQ